MDNVLQWLADHEAKITFEEFGGRFTLHVFADGQHASLPLPPAFRIGHLEELLTIAIRVIEASEHTTAPPSR